MNKLKLMFWIILTFLWSYFELVYILYKKEPSRIGIYLFDKLWSIFEEE